MKTHRAASAALLFSFIGIAAAFGQETVTWTNTVGAFATGGTLRQTGPSGSGGALSTKSIVSGAGYVEFKILESGAAKACGLSHGYQAFGLGDLDFAFYADAAGLLHVYESGAPRLTVGSYAVGDTLRVSVDLGAVTYSRNGSVVSTSSVPARYPLLAEAFLETSGASIGTATLNGLLAYNVTWRDAAGVTASGNNLVRGPAPAAWDAGARSTKVLSGNGWAEVGAVETNTFRMFGLGHADGGASFVDIDFAIYLTSGGEFGIYESGVPRAGHGPYAAGDRFRVEVASGVVYYKRNGAVFDTSTVAPTFPLVLDTTFYSPGATVQHAVIGGQLVPNVPPQADAAGAYDGYVGEVLKLDGRRSADPDGVITSHAWDFGDGSTAVGTSPLVPHVYSAPGSYTANLTVTDDEGATHTAEARVTIRPALPRRAVEWTNLVGTSVEGTDLKKTASTAAWDAGASSTRAVASGDAYVEVTASETHLYRLVGLSSGDTDQGYADIDFALYLAADGQIYVFEGGINRGAKGAYATGDRLRVSVAGGAVRYTRNGFVLYTSTLSPAYPLLVDTALFSTGATIQSAVLARAVNAPPVADAGGTYSGAVGEPLTLSARESVDPDGAVVSYAWTFSEGGTGSGPAVTRTYTQPGSYEATVVVTDEDGATDDARATITIGPPLGVVWKNVVGATASGSTLTRSSPTPGWDAGAVSTKELRGDGYVEFAAVETNTYRMAGLSRGDSDQSYTDIDFAIYLTSTGRYGVFEGGTHRGELGAYVAGDRFRVEVSGGVVRYKRNGEVVSPGPVVPSFPLLVDTSLYSPGASIVDAIIAGQVTSNALPRADAGGEYLGHAGDAIQLDARGSVDPDGVIVGYAWEFGDGSTASGPNPTVPHVYADAGPYTVRLTVTDNEGATHGAEAAVTIASAATRAPVQWTALRNASVEGDTLTKLGTPAWDAGAVSSAVIAADGYVEATIAETNSYRLIGLSHGDTDASYQDVDFAIDAAGDGQLYVFEKGVLRGARGPYAAGDRLRVSVIGGVVRYTRNGRVLYRSTESPAFPLLVDTSLYSTGATIKAATIGRRNVEPVANAGSTYYGVPGEPVEFAANASTDADGTIVSYLWTFGDGTTRTGVSVTRTYSAPIDDTVTLTVTDNDGATDSDSVPVKITAPVSVFWKNRVGVVASGSSLQKTGPGTAWDAGAVSTKVLTGDGFAEFVATETNTYRMFGLSQGDANQDYQEIQYAIHLRPEGLWEIVEAGQLRSILRPYQAGDRFRVEVRSGVVRYKRNGETFQTSDRLVSFPLLIDTSLLSSGATITDAVIAGQIPPNTAPQPFAGLAYEGELGDAITFDPRGSTDDGVIVSYTWDFGDGSPPAPGPLATHTYADVGGYTARLTVTDEEGVTSSIEAPVSIRGALPRTPVAWKNVANVEPLASDLEKTAASDWTSGAVSRRAIASGNGYVETIVAETNTYRLLGLSRGDSDQGFADIDFAIYPAQDGNLYVYEKGVSRGGFGPYATGDRLRVLLIDGVVRYSHNGRVVHISTQPPVYPLLVDTALYTQGATLKSVVLARVNVPPVANAGGPYRIAAGIPLTLDGTSSYDPDGDVAEYRWTYHDNRTATGPNPSRVYEDVDTVPVTLVVVDDEGVVSSSAAGTVDVVVNQPPTLSLVVGAPCHAPCTVYVTATASDPEAQLVTVTWDGCAAGQAGLVAACTMSFAGTVTAVARASDGWVAPVERQAALVSTNAAPTAPVVTVAGSGCTIPCLATFTATAADPDGDPIAFECTACALGQTGATATCRLETPGTATAIVTVRDGRGGAASGQGTATAIAPGQNLPPEANLGGPYRGVVGRPITFDGRLSRDVDGQITEYAWTFGDGQWAPGPTPTHTYAEAQLYTLALRVTDDDGATHTGILVIKIEPNVDADDDGLTDAEELALGSSPTDADSNDDGLPDGTAKAMGLSLTSSDTDGDSVANAAELAAGTDPIKPDSDGDGVGDGTDAFPLDASRSSLPPPDPNDLTPPVITLERPLGAVEVQ